MFTVVLCESTKIGAAVGAYLRAVLTLTASCAPVGSVYAHLSITNESMDSYES